MKRLAILLLAGALVAGCGGERNGADAPPVDAPVAADTDVAAGIARSVADVDAANTAAAAPPDVTG